MEKTNNPKELLIELKKVLGTEKAILGTSNTMKAIRKGAITKVYLSSNAPQHVRDDLSHYSKIAGFSIAQLDVSNDELGTLCKKQFHVSLVSVRK